MSARLKLSIEIWRYLIVGGLNTVLTGILFYLCLRIFNINYLVSLICSWLAGILFSYVLNFLWVFKPEQQLRFQERFLKYCLIYAVSFATNLAILYYLVEYQFLDPWWVQFSLLPFIVVFNYLLTKFWSLRHYRQSTED